MTKQIWERQEKLNAFREKYPNALYWDVQDRLEKASNADLLCIWNALRRYDPTDTVTQGWETVSMDDWAQSVYSELSVRGLPA